MSENIEKRITSIEDLAAYSRGCVVELPPFGPDQPFVARLRRPSLLALAKTGRIPNTLLSQANKLFFGDDKKVADDALKNTFDVIDVLCEAAFVEPAFSELKKAGVELTDDQYMFVFNYTQQGVNSLANFRNKQADIQSSGAGD